jgi:hypothetical protein
MASEFRFFVTGYDLKNVISNRSDVTKQHVCNINDKDIPLTSSNV